MNAGFFHRRSPVEALEYYLTFGGVPKYLELYDDSRGVRLNIARLCFQPGAFFLDEFDRLFVSHFGKGEDHRAIVEFLADRAFATRAQIAARLGRKTGGQITRLVEDLCLAGFVEAYSSVHNPTSRVVRRFRISDPYLRFYLRFIRPQRARIAASPKGLPLHQALPDRRYAVFMGLAFERFCHWHADLLAEKLGFSAVAYDCGPWFRRQHLTTGAQIDLLFRRADRVTTLCEIKFRKHVGREVIADVEHKVAALSASGSPLESAGAIERVLVTAYPPTQDLRDEGYFARILTVDELAG